MPIWFLVYSQGYAQIAFNDSIEFYFCSIELGKVICTEPWWMRYSIMFGFSL